MHLVYVVPFIPYPPRDGASVRIWNTLRELSRHNTVDLVIHDSPPAPDVVAALRPMVHSLVFVPRPERRSRVPLPKAGRWTAVIDGLQYPPSYLQRYRSAELVERVGALLTAEGGVDWLLCDTQLSGQMVLSRTLPRVRRALCLFDLYDLSFRRKMALPPFGPYKLKFLADWLKVRHYERRIMRAFDLLTVVSTLDQQLVHDAMPGMRTLLVPNGVDLDYFRPDPVMRSKAMTTTSAPTLDGTATILFVASLNYEPNADGLRYFLDTVWPRVSRRKPDARFIVVGRQPPQWLLRVAQRDSTIRVLGLVDDVRPLYDHAQVVVVPLRLGGGTKLKLIEALAMGVPVVATPEGCAGVDAQDGVHLLMASTPEQFAAHIVQLLENEEMARGLALAGRALVEERYGWPAIIAAFEQTLRDGLMTPSEESTMAQTHKTARGGR